jgi:hypothetical protein
MDWPRQRIRVGGDRSLPMLKSSTTNEHTSIPRLMVGGMSRREADRISLHERIHGAPPSGADAPPVQDWTPEVPASAEPPHIPPLLGDRRARPLAGLMLE